MNLAKRPPSGYVSVAGSAEQPTKTLVESGKRSAPMTLATFCPDGPFATTAGRSVFKDRLTTTGFGLAVRSGVGRFG